jgi:hypothetical protein
MKLYLNNSNYIYNFMRQQKLRNEKFVLDKVKVFWEEHRNIPLSFEVKVHVFQICKIFTVDLTLTKYTAICVAFLENMNFTK